MWKWITGALGLIASVFAAMFYRSESKRHEQRADQFEDENEAMVRVNEAVTEQQRANNESVKEARNKQFDTDDINELLRGGD